MINWSYKCMLILQMMNFSPDHQTKSITYIILDRCNRKYYYLDWIGLEYLFSPISIIIINLTTGLALWGVYLIVVDCYC